MTETLNPAASMSTTAAEPGGALLTRHVLGPYTFAGAAAVTGLIVSVLSGTTTTTPIAPQANVRWMSYVVGGTGNIVDDSGRIVVTAAARTEVSAYAAMANTASAAELVHWLHEQSGLTWDQLGKMFGVSRRAVHLWANGARMNATNLARLHEIVAVVREIPARTPEDARTRLMATGTDGQSVVSRFRARNMDGDINGLPFAPQQLFDALPVER